ncbi:hypothetical protein [Acinetobacter towneri]|uniref:hypothetical protein n=1 Tax=Acinetobacter towneri TaxID=202956 RepID=UPI003AEF1892
MVKFFRMGKLIILLSSCLGLLACQNSDTPPVPEPPQVQTSASEPVDLTQMCDNIQHNMQQIDNTRTTFALEQINQDLKVCLPLLPLAEQLKLLDLSTQMYQRFLHVERSATEQLAFEQHAFDMAQHPTIQQSHFEKFAARDQYLLKHKGQAYLELHDAGASKLAYRRSPQYLAIIFAPYMPDAEQVFIERLANDNMQSSLQDAGLTLDATDIAERALFWEDYLQRYPKSHFIADARYLAELYAMLLFKGTAQSPVSYDYVDESSIQPAVLFEVKKLAELQKSTLANQARKFIAFLQMSAEQRLNEISAQPTAQQKREHGEQALVHAQLNQYLNLKTTLTNSKRDCFSDGICLPL